MLVCYGVVCTGRVRCRGVPAVELDWLLQAPCTEYSGTSTCRLHPGPTDCFHVCERVGFCNIFPSSRPCPLAPPLLSFSPPPKYSAPSSTNQPYRPTLSHLALRSITPQSTAYIGHITRLSPLRPSISSSANRNSPVSATNKTTPAHPPTSAPKLTSLWSPQ